MEKNSLIHKMFTVLLSMIILVVTVNPVLALEKDDGLIEGVDYDVIEIIVSDEDLRSDDEQFIYPVNQSRMLPGWSIKNKRNGGKTGKQVGGTVEGPPGGTISLSHSESLSFSVTITAGVSIKDVSAAFSNNITTSKTITHNYSYAVPKTHNGKKVRSAKITAYSESAQLFYDIFHRNNLVKKGVAHRFVNMKYTVTIYY